MDEKLKRNLAKIVGHNGEPERLRREVAIIKDKRQFSIRIPRRFAQLANVDEKRDRFEFTLEPLDEEGEEFGIKAVLVRGGSVGGKGI